MTPSSQTPFELYPEESSNEIYLLPGEYRGNKQEDGRLDEAVLVCGEERWGGVRVGSMCAEL